MENEIHYKSLVRCIPNGMFMLDREKKIITWNSAAERIFGLGADDVLGRSCLESGICSAMGDTCPLFDDTIEKPVMGHECRLTLHGREMILLKNMELLRDGAGAVHGGIETFIDITELRHLESDLAAARKLAQSAVVTQGDFLANLSHELRTPMNGIMGLIDLTLDTALDEKQRQYLKMAKCSSESLMHLLNDLLDFSKLETGRGPMAFEIFDVAAMVHATAASQIAQIESAGLSVSVETDANVPAFVHGDPARLRQILLNLLGNALKYTDTGGVTLSVRVSADRGDLCRADDEERKWLLFEVSDTGIGIPEEKRLTVFDAFTQVDGTRSRNHVVWDWG